MDDQDEEVFVAIMDQLQKDAYKTAEDKGWVSRDVVLNFGETIALMHSELSEALEAMRYENPPSEHIPEFSGVEEEFADVVIRMLHNCEARGWRLADAIVAKMAYNKTRQFKHGGKAF
jgi:NTP pyrophosphatase (non-canonical NTP hydrolase)